MYHRACIAREGGDIDYRQAVGELLWNLGYRDVKDPQAFIKEQFKKVEKWNTLCNCLKWGKNTSVETILMQFNALNKGNQEKRKKLETIKKLLDKSPLIRVHKITDAPIPKVMQPKEAEP